MRRYFGTDGVRGVVGEFLTAELRGVGSTEPHESAGAGSAGAGAGNELGG